MEMPLKMKMPAVTVYWPQRRLHGVLAAAPAHDATLWLVGFRVAATVLCVVDITHDRRAADADASLEVIGVCRPQRQVDSSDSKRADESTLLVVEVAPFGSTRTDAAAMDRSLVFVSTGATQHTPSIVVLYDPKLFTRGLARAGIAAMSSTSPLYPPLQEMQDYFSSQALASASRTTRPVVTAFENLAYYAVGLPFAAANVVWQKTLLSLLSAPLLRSLPVDRKAAIKDYSQCLSVFAHRWSNMLTLPAQVRARYHRHGAGSYTELCDFVVYLVIDYALGVVFASFVSSTALPATQQVGLSPVTFLETVREHVVWLMDAPAGFKLNDRLAAILGNGLLMWLDFWDFLLNAVMTSSLWQAAMDSSKLHAVAYQCWAHAGFTLQLSAIADALWLTTWNSYWVFVYFTKLNGVQLRLLSSLWKLFLGKKNNVLRKRVDSCEYDVNQLLLGTLLFTILVFLTTTNAVFFIFFGIVRLAVWMASASLWIPIVVLRGLPIVSILDRLLNPREYTATLSIETLDDQSSVDALTIQDISPSRRRARDAVDQQLLRNFLQQPPTTSASPSPVFFRVVTKPSGVGHLFHRLQAYQKQLARAYNGAAIVNSCLFGAEIAPVDASGLFRTGSTTTSTPLADPLAAKCKRE